MFKTHAWGPPMFSWLNEKRTDSLGTGIDAMGISAGYQLVAH